MKLVDETQENEIQMDTKKSRKKLHIRMHIKPGKKKIILLSLLAVVVVGMIAGSIFLRSKKGAAQAMTYSFIRTTTLTKGSLEDSVSCTGTVGSANTSTVTYTGSGVGNSAKIKTVNVSVGDSVEEGDVIVTLDTSDIEDSITKEKESIASQVEKAQSSYDKAKENYDSAYTTYTNYASTYNSASSTLSSTSSNYSTAAASVASFQTTYNNAAAAEEAAGKAYNEKLTAYNSANASYLSAKSAYEIAQSAADAATEQEEKTALQATANTCKTTMETAEGLATTAQTASDTAKSAYETAQTNTQTALEALNDAKKACNYDAYYSAYTQAQSNYTAVCNQYNQYASQKDTYKEAMEQAAETLEDASTSDNLEDLYEQLADCSLSAETAGKVTALNASVGGTPSGTIATIQDTETLKISITISESDINDVSVGMSCLITSDATTETINGSLSQIDPVAGQNGSFGAEVTVEDENSGLLIGMNATVQIVKSSSADCYMVPRDAIGNDEDEKGDYVYRQTGGSGTDMEFEKVYVTTGESNDYYIEIAAADLKEGDVIRSSADLTQGLETTDEATTQSDMNLGGLFHMGGTDSGAGRGNMKQNAGGNSGMPSAPSGDMGGMPAGGN